MSIRKITDEQFADGTTIDGDRLDTTIQDLEEFINSIPNGDIKTRWIPQTIHYGYLPLTDDAVIDLTNTYQILEPRGPWLPICNKGANSLHSADISNQFRIKGTKLPYRGPVPVTDSYNNPPYNTEGPDQIAWTMSMALGRPAILYAVNVYLLTDDEEFTNSFQYGGVAPAGRTASSFTEDLQFALSLDNPFSPENQKSHNKVYQKREFSLEGHMFLKTNATPTNDMDPALSAHTGVVFNFHQSVAYEVSDLRIPLPIDSRIRFSLTMPLNLSNNGTGVNLPWGKTPQLTFVPSISLTILEPMLDD